MKTKFLSVFMTLALIVGLTSCNDSNDNGKATFLNYMTLVANNTTGSVLEMYNVSSKSMLTFTSDRTFDEKSNVKVGDRVLVMYGYPDGRTPLTSGAIELLAFRAVTNGVISWENTNGLPMGELQTHAVSVEGAYLNYEGLAVYFNDYKTLRLVADETTLDDKMPVVYLQYESGDNVNGTWKPVYASFNISAIWSNAKYDGFILRINDTNSSLSNLTFKREDILKPIN